MSSTQNEKPTVFITYDWNDTSDIFIDDLKKTITNVTFVVDKKDVGCWQSLTDFMATIKEQDFVIQLLTDKYLKSPNCLYEVMQLMNSDNWQKKTMTIVMKDAEGIYDNNKKIEYIEYWCSEVEKLEKRMKVLPESAIESFKGELEKIKNIRDNIGNFLLIAADRLNPKLANAIEAIQNKISSMSGVSPAAVSAIPNNVTLLNEKGSLAKIWSQVVPLFYAMNKTQMAMYDFSKIEELKEWREKTHQLVVILESHKLYISKEVYRQIDGYVNQICKFYDTAVWVCSLSKTTQSVKGLAQARYVNQIAFYSDMLNKIKENIESEYGKIMELVER